MRYPEGILLILQSTGPEGRSHFHSMPPAKAEAKEWRSVMNPYQQMDLRSPGPTPEASLPPANVGETGWDILLALHSSPRHEMRIRKLGSLLSVSPHVLSHWLGWLEDRWLVIATKEKINDEIGTTLTRHGREVLDRYLSAINALYADR